MTENIQNALTDLLSVLDKAQEGCSTESWAGHENGHGVEFGNDLDAAIAKARKAVEFSADAALTQEPAAVYLNGHFVQRRDIPDGRPVGLYLAAPTPPIQLCVSNSAESETQTVLSLTGGSQTQPVTPPVAQAILIAHVTVSDDDLDMGFSEDFIAGKVRLPNGTHDLYNHPKDADSRDAGQAQPVRESLRRSAMTSLI